MISPPSAEQIGFAAALQIMGRQRRRSLIEACCSRRLPTLPDVPSSKGRVAMGIRLSSPSRLAPVFRSREYQSTWQCSSEQDGSLTGAQAANP
jgi:hypothetical protein